MKVRRSRAAPPPAAPWGDLLCGSVVFSIQERVGCCWQLQDEVASLLHVSFFPSVPGGTREQHVPGLPGLQRVLQ